jgi:hypothetical protein
MATISNHFSVLDDIEDNFPDVTQTMPMSPVCSSVNKESEPINGFVYGDTTLPNNSPKKGAISRVMDFKWGDVEDDDDPIGDVVSIPIAKRMESAEVSTTKETEKFVTPASTSTGQNIAYTQQDTDRKSNEQPKAIMTDEEKQAWKTFDHSLSNKRELEVIHNVRVYNKDTKEVTTEKNTRKFRVVSKSVYDGFRKIISKYRTHNGNRINYHEQVEKIKLANSLMEIAFKDPKVPCCYVYPVIIITLESGKTLTRNEVHKGSKCFFEVSDISYYPAFSQN